MYVQTASPGLVLLFDFSANETKILPTKFLHRHGVFAWMRVRCVCGGVCVCVQQQAAASSNSSKKGGRHSTSKQPTGLTAGNGLEPVEEPDATATLPTLAGTSTCVGIKTGEEREGVRV
jgi:hypothetical protein